MGEPAVLALPARPEDARRARQFARDVLTRRWGHSADNVELVVDELVTNAIFYGAPPIAVSLRRAEGTIRVEVADAGNLLPVHEKEHGSMTGHGLGVVAALSLRWGVTRRSEGGKVVWAELAIGDGLAAAEGPIAGEAEGSGDQERCQSADGAPVFTVRLGPVPTAILTTAVGRMDDLLRELTLAEFYAEATHQARPFQEPLYAVLAHFAEVRAAVKCQLAASAAAGTTETSLVLRLRASAADAAETYLAALEAADRQAQTGSLLTEAASAAEQVFRRWFVSALADQLRALAADEPAPHVPTFAEALAEELNRSSASPGPEEARVGLAGAEPHRTVPPSKADQASGATSLGAVSLPRVDTPHAASSRRANWAKGAEDAPGVRVHPWLAALTGLALVAIATGVVFELKSPFTYYPATWFILIVLVASRLGGWQPGLATAAAATIGLWFSTIPPRGTLAIPRTLGARFGIAVVALMGLALVLAERGDWLAISRLKRFNARSAALRELALELEDALDVKSLAETVANYVPTALETDGFALGVLDANDGTLRWLASRWSNPAAEQYYALASAADDARSSLPAADAIRYGQPVVFRTRDEYLQRYPGNAEAPGTAEFGSTVAWPLRVGGLVVGVLTLAWHRHHEFRQAELDFIATLCELVAQSLVRGRAYEDERALATALQRTMVPAVVEKSVAGLSLAARYKPAGVVGGDWYDATELLSGEVLFIVGDVVGHGLSSTADMVRLRHAALALAVERFTPAETLRGLNHVAAAAKCDFATCVIALVDPASGTLCYANAGHPPFILRRAIGSVSDFVSSRPGPALGADPDASYVDHQFKVDERDVVIMYTDGLIERRREDFGVGLARLLRAVSEWQPADSPTGQPAESLADLCSHLEQTCTSVETMNDDVCIVCFSTDGSHAPAAVDGAAR